MVNWAIQISKIEPVQTKLPHYDWSRSYEWNYAHPPAPVECEIRAVPGEWDYCGLKVGSPLGIPAGPLLNGAWCLYYASLGFDVLTYKTVRSRSHKCYGMPNLQPVECGPLRAAGGRVESCSEMLGSWAVSFGMPSKSPEIWRPDVESTRKQLPASKLLAVSVVGTVQPGWGIGELADDYGRCARWAMESGADVVETNFSCPNVSTRDGQLYQLSEAAQCVAERVRESIGSTPYLVKIGHVPSDHEADRLIGALDGIADAVVMTNSIAATVAGQGGKLLFAGQPRGICGNAILAASIEQVERFSHRIRARRSDLRIVGVGGIRTARDVRRYCAAGAHAIQVATAVMSHPELGLSIREDLASSATKSP